MKRLSSAQVAQALAVSESSIKRWCDQGRIQAERTAGGHRRVAVPELLRFLRESDQTLVHPEVLRLPELADTDLSLDELTRDVYQALADGDERRFRSLCLGMFLDGWTMPEICDGVLSRAFRKLGERWQHGVLEIYQERHASDICLRWLYEMTRLLPQPSTWAPKAVGASFEGDWYTLPITMAEVCLREIGWNARAIGPNLPVESLVAAAEHRGPRLFFLSVSHVGEEGEEDLIGRSHTLYDDLKERGVALVLGGSRMNESLRQRMGHTAVLEDLTRLVAFAEALEPDPGNRARRPPRTRKF